MKDIVSTILIGGRAGEGVKKAAQVLANLLCSSGKHVCQADDYQSLIRGGHNFSLVSFSAEPVYCAHHDCDLIICFDQRSVDEHRARLKDGGLLFFNSDEAKCDGGIPIPMNSIMKRHYHGPANVSLASLAIFGALTGLSSEQMSAEISKQYKREVDENTAFAKEIYQLVKNRVSWGLDFSLNIPYRFISGNQGIIQGAWKAGLDFYYGYPMTPASSLLHYAALKQESHGIQAIHAESELAAANMALGTALAGCRVAVGSSGGGFALMQEAFSAAGMVEAPVLFILSSRPGPATGVSTYTAQEDLFMALSQGHGEFDRVVACPDSISRAMTLAAELMSIAWKYQIPTLLLTDKELSEGSANISLPQQTCPAAEPVLGEPGPEYKRYRITEDGVSPLCFPGSSLAPNSVIKYSTHEHQEMGYRTDKAPIITAMKEKRARKAAGIKASCAGYPMVSEYGEGELLIFAYGSTVLELREAQKYCSVPFKIVAPIYLEPFPSEELAGYKNAQVVVVEHSQYSQFARFLSQNLGVELIKNINKYDGRPFDPKELARLIEEL